MENISDSDKMSVVLQDSSITVFADQADFQLNKLKYSGMCALLSDFIVRAEGLNSCVAFSVNRRYRICHLQCSGCKQNQ